MPGRRCRHLPAQRPGAPGPLRVDVARRRIVLTAPLRMARGMAVGFAEQQAGWIAARLKRLPARRPFVDGAEVPLFGTPHRVRHRPDRRGTVWVEDGEIHVAGRVEHLPRRLRDWLTAEMRKRLAPLVHAKAERVERTVKRITARDARAGAVATDGAMPFSCAWFWRRPKCSTIWSRSGAPVHMNHGPRFWALAEHLCDGPMDPPQAWLRANGETCCNTALNARERRKMTARLMILNGPISICSACGSRISTARRRSMP